MQTQVGSATRSFAHRMIGEVLLPKYLAVRAAMAGPCFLILAVLALKDLSSRYAIDRRFHAHGLLLRVT